MLSSASLFTVHITQVLFLLSLTSDVKVYRIKVKEKLDHVTIGHLHIRI